MGILHIHAEDICTDASSNCFGKCGNCCEAHESFISQMRSWADSGAHGSTEKIFKKYFLHLRDHHGYKGFEKTSHSGNGAPQGAFAFTLTMSPADGLTEADMVCAVRKLMKQRSCPVKKYAWYLEYGDPETKEHPHIHGMYETEKGGVIEKKHFQRAWKIWDPTQKLGAGFRGGYHRPVRSDEAYSQYIAKQNILGESA